MKKCGIIIIVLIIAISAMAQQDTLAHSRSLDSVVVISYLNQNIVRPMPNVHGSYILSGKKTELIDLTHAAVDIANKTGRQLFAKVPGMFVYHMDGAGNQVNIATRGLDPHRGWEFNSRKDGIITNSDMYGYPASHYSMPLESIARIEIVRGTGSLQYGAQFGGMLNYITKQGDTTRPVSFESINTVGSFNLLSTYNAIGGKSGKFKYYAYMHKKSRNGYRDNERTESEAQAIILTYEPTEKFSIRAEWARSKYLYRIPGPLTDSMFHADPSQASRSRNFYSPDMHLPSVNINWQIAPQTRLQLIQSAVIGTRGSVQFDKPTNIHDTINVAAGQYNNRQVDIDQFNSYTTELRLLQEYLLGKKVSTLAAGIQFMNNDMHRRQMGKGTTGSDYDLALVEPGWGRDVHLKTKNIALFAENKFQVLNSLSVNLGARVEIGKTNMSGTISYYSANDLPVSIKHEFPLFGVNFSYRPAGNLELYGGWSQAYHPMLFADLIPGSTFEKVDPNIKDAKGYNAELGFRGSWQFLRWDVTGFLLKYDKRFGKLAETDNTGAFYTWRTNIGNSLSKGVEMLIQADWLLGNRTGLSLFTSTAFLDARYKKAFVKSGNDNIGIDGNKVESAPNLITRNGASLRYKKISFSILYSYTAKSFADALNTIEPLKTTGAVGLVPAYGLLDLNATFRISKNIEARANANNLLDKQYFTKRPQFYPGPGVWPSEGRNFSTSLIIRL
jgi:Fe(3+) dicitrate transport protein